MIEVTRGVEVEVYITGWNVGREGGGRAECPYKPTDALGRYWVAGQLHGEIERQRQLDTFGASPAERAKMEADFRADGYGDEPAAVVEVWHAMAPPAEAGSIFVSIEVVLDCSVRLPASIVPVGWPQR